MQSYLERYISQLVEELGSSQYAEDCILDILMFLEEEIIPITGNHFDELVSIAIITRYMDETPARHYRNAVKTKILQERGAESGMELIRKFS